MIDGEVRDLERRWRSTGDPEDLLRLTRAQVRSGERSRDCRSLTTRASCRCFACRELNGIPPARVVRVVASQDAEERTVKLRWEVDDSGEGAGTAPPVHPPGVELRKFEVSVRLDEAVPLRDAVTRAIGAAVEEGVEPGEAERIVLYGGTDPLRVSRTVLFSTLPTTFGRDLAWRAGQEDDHLVRSALRTLGGCICRPRRAAINCPFHGREATGPLWGSYEAARRQEELARRLIEMDPDEIETVTFDSITEPWEDGDGRADGEGSGAEPAGASEGRDEGDPGTAPGPPGEGA